jgi:hypothetical protein
MQSTNGSFENVYFAGFTSPGKSGEWITSDFRFAVGMKALELDDRFIHLSSLNQYRIVRELEDTPKTRFFVFLDDYVGTGDSALKTWTNIQADTNDTDRYILATLVATEEALARIKKLTPDLKVVYGRRIKTTCKVFHPQNKMFTSDEKAIIRNYCTRANPINPTGYGDIQSLVVFYQRVADNVIPVLNWFSDGVWEPLFPRTILPLS